MSFNPYYTQQGYAPQQQPLAFQQTGYTSQYAPQSVQTPHFQPPPLPEVSGKYDQLSFLSPQDQSRFEQLFNAQTNTVSISPESARAILLQSNLSPHNLARIWELSDINKTGDLLFPEFALALHLCNVVLRGGELPYELEPRIKDEVSSQVDKINFSVPESQLSRDNSSINAAQQTKSQPQGSIGAIFETNPVALGLSTQPIPSAVAYWPQQNNSLQVQQTGFAQPQLFSSPQKQEQQEFSPYNAQPLASQPTGFGFQASNTLTPPALPQKPPLLSQPQQQSQPENQSLPSLAQQQTGFNTQFQSDPAPSVAPLALQPTGLVPLKTQTTGAPVQRQQTGIPTASMLAAQTTGFQSAQTETVSVPTSSSFNTSIQTQPAGLLPLNTQRTGQAPPLQHQPTGLVPLNAQQTGQPLNHQPTGLVPINGQQSGLTQQPTGKLIPLNANPTGSIAPLTQQITGKLISLNTQATGAVGPLNQQLTGLIPLKQQPTGLVPLKSTTTGGLARQPTGLVPLQSMPTGAPLAPLQAQKTGFGQNSFFITNLVQQSDEVAQSYNYLQNMQMTSDEKKLFNKIFDNFDTDKKGLLSAETCAEIFRKSGLNREDLEKVWDLVARANQTHLDKESFQMGMYLVYKRLNGFEIPEELPDSLKPSSMRILDHVKNQLKVQSGSMKTMKKSSNSRIDGSRFKNNDDELISSSSRHRRKHITKTQTEKRKNEILGIEEMKKLIKEKKILLDALDVQLEETADDEKVYEAEDLRTIERLKDNIRNLPSLSSGSFERDQLKDKFNHLTSRVPTLLSDIAAVDNSITGLKLELFKLKNPTSVLGTGPNGEITDADRVRAKSKLLLAQRMSQLTGKPIDPELESMASDASKLNEEAQKIQENNLKNQQMIRDIESSIREISASVLAGFDTKTDEEGYKKWELGVGLQPEVQELIKSMRISEVTQKVSSLSVNAASLPQTYTPSPPVKQPLSPSPLVSSTSTSTAPIPKQVHRTEEERKVWIREQARKKMEERMAKLGIRKTSNPSSPRIVQPEPLATPDAVHVPVSATGNLSSVEQRQKDEDSSSDDDDEEEFQRMEEIRRLKRLERDARLSGIEDNADSQPEKGSTNGFDTQYHDSNSFSRKN